MCRIFCIHTIDGGHNSGRSTILQAETEYERDDWVAFLKKASQDAVEEFNRPPDLGTLQNLQRTCRNVYNSNAAQYTIGVVILASYVTAMTGAQLLPEDGTQEASYFFTLEIIFTVIFTLELLFNLFGSWFWPFWEEAWNWMDSFVVVISIAGLIDQSIPAVNVLRLVRVFKMVLGFRVRSKG
jgi:hypothetical protein